jgi:Lhr-like helicase
METETKEMVCVHNDHTFLTKGKSYEIIEEDDNKVFVIDDRGVKTSFYRSRFE